MAKRPGTPRFRESQMRDCSPRRKPGWKIKCGTESRGEFLIGWCLVGKPVPSNQSLLLSGYLVG